MRVGRYGPPPACPGSSLPYRFSGIMKRGFVYIYGERRHMTEKTKKTSGSAHGGVPSRGWEHWSDEEKRYLFKHAADGYLLIGEALGRSGLAVKRKCARMGVRVSRYPIEGELCPRCGTGRITASDRNAVGAGVCPICWEQMKAEAMEERAAYLRTRRRYEAAKKRVRDERKRARADGLDPDTIDPRAGRARE